VFAKTLKNVQKTEKLIINFLRPIGLNLSKEKTRVGHSMEKKPGTSGFIGLNFLSFHFKHVRYSKHRGVKNTRGITQLFKFYTMPFREAVVDHKKDIKRILIDCKGAPLGRVIERLAFCIKGWCWYHSVTQSMLTFSQMDEWLFKKLWKLVKRRYRIVKKAK
jgi:hypothetical protein